jgi:hypothetical protein
MKPMVNAKLGCEVDHDRDRSACSTNSRAISVPRPGNSAPSGLEIH